MRSHRWLRHPRGFRRTLAATLVGLLAVPAAAVIVAPVSAQAQTRQVVVASAYAQARGYTVGIAVLDTRTGSFYGAGHFDGFTYASESIVKVFIATRLLVTGQMFGSTAARAYKMITQSDDAIASSLYGRVGGDGLINWMKGYFHEPDLGSPPRRANWWGNTHIRAKGLVHLYAKLKANRRVGPWLLNAMHHATPFGSDGTFQFFGIPSATHGAAIKQGWGTDYDDWSASADFNTTGFVGNDRYAVAILARGPVRTYGRQIGAMLTSVARQLLPRGAFPDPIPTVRGLSVHSGTTGGGTGVTIVGADLTGVQRVFFGLVPARVIRSVSPTRLTAIAPAHLRGLVHVRVGTGHGTSRRLINDQYLYVPAPAITALSSHSGRTGGGTSLTVSGSDFTQVTRVAFGTTPARVVRVVSAARLQVTVPPHAAGSVRVSVSTSYGTSPSVSAGLYTYVAPPKVTTVVSRSGPAAGGTRVKITGTGFAAASTVLFGTVAGTAVTVTRDGSLTVTAPAHRATIIHLRVVTPYGTSPDTAAGQYAYTRR